MNNDFSSKSYKKVAKAQAKKTGERKFKRPLSAYNIFFREERQRILTDALVKSGEALTTEQLEQALQTGPDRPHRKAHGKISFVALVRTVGQRWRKLSTSEKAVYEHMASRERVSFHMKNASGKETKQEHVSLFNKAAMQDIKMSSSPSNCDGIIPDNLYSSSQPSLSDAIIPNCSYSASLRSPSLHFNYTTNDCLLQPVPLSTDGLAIVPADQTSIVGEEWGTTDCNQVLLQDLSTKLDVESVDFLQSCFCSFNY